MQTKLRLSARGDQYEQEADRVADEVMRHTTDGASVAVSPIGAGAGVPPVQRMCAECASGAHKCDECEKEEEESSDAPEVQRKERDQPAAKAAKGALLVDDDVEPAPDQLRKGDFLARLRPAICAAADEELVRAGRTTKGCPYLDYWFGVVERRSAWVVERMARRYAPETAAARTAAEYIEPIVARIRHGVAVWAATGQLEGIPSELSALAAGASAEGGGAPPRGGVQMKERGGNARAAATIASAASPHALQSSLGGGRALDAGVRGRMESAFGADFSRVRVHSDHTAAGLSTSLGARAFTVGEHVAFDSGEYRPGTLVGDALIAHELAHVVQQGAASRDAAQGDTQTDAEQHAGADAQQYESLEGDADWSALGAMSRLWRGAHGAFSALSQLASTAAPRMRSGVRLQRCKNTVKRCPKGKSWQVIGSPPAGGSFGCICTWRCLPATPSDPEYIPGSGGASINCYPEPCAKPSIEIVDDDYTIVEDGTLKVKPAAPPVEEDPGREWSHGASLADPNNPMVAGSCGCSPMNIEGGGSTSAPLKEVELDLAGLHPHAAKELFKSGGEAPLVEGPRAVIEGPAVAGETVRKSSGKATTTEGVKAAPEVVKPLGESPPPPEVKQIETKPVETKPVEQKPVEQKPVEQKPVEQKPVEQKAAEKPAAATAPKYGSLAEIITEDGSAFKEPALEEAYQGYKKGKDAKNEKVLSREEWARKATSGAPAKLLESLLPKDFRKGAPGTPLPPVDVNQIPTPADYKDAQRAKDLATVMADRPRLLERLAKLLGVDLSGGKIDGGHLRILKGNIGEILARPIRARLLAARQAKQPAAQEWTNVKVQIMDDNPKSPTFGKLGDPKLFSDFIVGETKGKTLELYDIGEVKTDKEGGVTATTQTFEWNEGRITDGSVLILPDGRTFTYKPTTSGTPELLGVYKSGRTLIAPKGARFVGERAGDRPGSTLTPETLDLSSPELNALARDVVLELAKEQAAKAKEPAK